jgi:hypothetical protein
VAVRTQNLMPPGSCKKSMQRTSMEVAVVGCGYPREKEDAYLPLRAARVLERHRCLLVQVPERIPGF